MSGKDTVRLSLAVEDIVTVAGQRALAQAADVLRAGGTVGFATETVYGLGANALDISAVEKIFIAKQRPGWDPLIVHISNSEMLQRVALDISAIAQRLMEAFWPGPLTLLLPRQGTIPSIVTAGRALVGVRMPAHPVARALIEAAGVPVAAPSANRFGHTSPTTAQHVWDDLNGRIDLLLDSGPAWCGVESTVIEVREQSTILYRPGAITSAEIERIVGPVTVYRPSSNDTEPEGLPSPGVGIRHYAPRAAVILVEVEAAMESVQREFWLRALRQHAASSRPGAMLPTGWPLPPDFAGPHYAWGSWNDSRQLAQNLFFGLRSLDSMGVETILCPLPPETGLGAAIRDRLMKAARRV